MNKSIIVVIKFVYIVIRHMFNRVIRKACKSVIFGVTGFCNDYFVRQKLKCLKTPNLMGLPGLKPMVLQY